MRSSPQSIIVYAVSAFKHRRGRSRARPGRLHLCVSKMLDIEDHILTEAVVGAGDRGTRAAASI